MKDVTLLPLDIYQVVNKSLLSENDKLILTMLYMPIIGNTATILYNTLYNELKSGGFISKELNHKHLMSFTNCTLDNIKKARIALEGIGLMKTYVIEGNFNSYVYELYSPLSANEFFNHPIFNIALYNSVGKEEYDRIKNSFKVPKLNLNGYKEITAPFDMTFKSKSEIKYVVENDIEKKETLPLSYEISFDFDTFISSMPKGLMNKSALTKGIKELITHLAFLYDLDPITMADMVKVSLNEKGLINKEELKNNTRKYYEYSHRGKMPRLIYKNQPEELRNKSNENSSKNRMIKVFETTSPRLFLKSKYKNAEPTKNDLQILEMLVVDLKLNPAVCNVLIDYILKTNKNRLIKSYVEVVAGEWKRANLETAKEAMEYAENSLKETRKRKNIKKEPKKEEIEPIWFNKVKEKEKMNEETEEELKEFLKEFV